MHEPRVKLPYYRALDQLPCDLPTLDEISKAHTIEDPQFGKRIAAVGENFIVKHGVRTRENEGNTLLFVEKYLNIPVPRLYAMYRVERELYLVMERIEGSTLESIWSSLTNEHKSSIVAQLNGIVNKMRALPPPSPSFFGSVDKGSLGHRFFLSVNPSPGTNGPFHDENEFNAALALRAGDVNSHQLRLVADFFARQLPKALYGHETVFTHSDWHQGNILVSQGADEQYTVTYVNCPLLEERA